MLKKFPCQLEDRLLLVIDIVQLSFQTGVLDLSVFNAGQILAQGGDDLRLKLNFYKDVPEEIVGLRASVEWWNFLDLKILSRENVNQPRRRRHRHGSVAGLLLILVWFCPCDLFSAFRHMFSTFVLGPFETGQKQRFNGNF